MSKLFFFPLRAGPPWMLLAVVVMVFLVAAWVPLKNKK